MRKNKSWVSMKKSGGPGQNRQPRSVTVQVVGRASRLSGGRLACQEGVSPSVLATRARRPVRQARRPPPYLNSYPAPRSAPPKSMGFANLCRLLTSPHAQTPFYLPGSNRAGRDYTFMPRQCRRRPALPVTGRGEQVGTALPPQPTVLQRRIVVLP